MATDPTVTVATGLFPSFPLVETPMSISRFMVFGSGCNQTGRFFHGIMHQVRAGGNEKERRGKAECSAECQAAGSSALMQN